MKFNQAIIDSLKGNCYPPTGVWRDFQHDYDYYQWLLILVKIGKFETSDLPPEPVPTDYADTEASRTRPL